MGNTDCTQPYTYTVTCDEFGECSTPNYETVTLTPTPANGFAFASWSGACSGTGSCSVTMDDDRTVSASFADAQNPSVFLTSPPNNALVRGTINVSASASDNTGVSRVDFLVGNVPVFSDNSPPYGLSFNTATIADGTATIAARATDNWNNQATASRTVTIDNTAPTIDDRKPARRASAKANITAHFLEAVGMDEASVEAVDGVTGLPTTFVLKKGTKVVPATVSYDPNTQVATLDPTKKLRSGARYVATVTTAAKDLAGNPLAANDTWSFRVR